VITLLDGPMGTRLGELGVDLDSTLWSAGAVHSAPETVRRVHREYARAGATVHTTNTFRTRRRTAGDRWAALTTAAVRLAREAVPSHHRVAGCIAPLEDCYRPDLSPEDPRPEHRELARLLADQPVDLLLCETFPHVGEALIAVEEAVATGVETWLALTPGPQGDLLDPSQVRDGAREAVARGASAVLVNCAPASRTLAWVEALSGLGVPFGAYANAGALGEGIGWEPTSDGPRRYSHHARSWLEVGATLVGSCCGTGTEHVHALKLLIDEFTGTGPDEVDRIRRPV